MKIHEHQAKEVLARFGVKVPRGGVAFAPDEAHAIARDLQTPVVVVKAQIHAGGRGKGGGVKVVKDLAQVEGVAGRILGMKLVTHQTGPEGKEVKKVLIEEGLRIDRELYLGIVVDRARRLPVLMACAEGGVEIEEIAARTPEKILKEWFDPEAGLHPFQARRVAKKLGLSGKAAAAAARLMGQLVRAFVEMDASLLEVNPLVVSGDEAIALDAKMSFDDNALYRHQGEVTAFRDLSEEEPKEIEAKQHGLSYIALDGDIGCLVNGAGLAMATMDIIKLHGGRPANFLDVGGGATREQVTEAFKIILRDPNVRAILVNIFGGIAKCDVIADGILAAARELALRVPLVVRLEGTNVEKGKAILASSGLNVTSAADMRDAAAKVVAAVAAGRA